MGEHKKRREVCIRIGSTPGSLSFKGQVTKQITEKGSIELIQKQVLCKIEIVSIQN